MPTKETRDSSSALRAYRKFLKEIVPIGVGLKEVNSRLDRDIYFALRKERGDSLRTISAEYNLVEAKGGYFESTGSFTLVAAHKKTGAIGLTIACAYVVHIHCKSPVDREMADRFTKGELRLILWPFFREFVFDLCGKMSIPPITIPLGMSDAERS
jgi:hypothetical protein